MSAFARLQQAAKRIKQDVMTVYFAARNPRTPVIARLLALAVAGYALSPIDLIPDFIPVLGYLDDLILLPLGILLIMKLVPADIIEESRTKAVEATSKPTSNLAAAIIVFIWVLCAAGCAYWVF
ncbi:MAG TPA: YkvA family protein [Candidatus Ozemobacteraceae bacterium]|nr:YkvA family protein [Candidatus Ozemobacteraceae bacterium]